MNKFILVIKQFLCKHNRKSSWFEVQLKLEFASLGVEHDFCQDCGKWLN